MPNQWERNRLSPGRPAVSANFRSSDSRLRYILRVGIHEGCVLGKVGPWRRAWKLLIHAAILLGNQAKPVQKELAVCSETSVRSKLARD
jgi:hypothetical protein